MQKSSSRTDLLRVTSKYTFFDFFRDNRVPPYRVQKRKMRKDGLPDESLKEFIMVEDRFLNLERLFVCTQTSRKMEAFGLS